MSDVEDLPEATWHVEIEPEKTRTEGDKEVVVEPARVHIAVGNFGSLEEAQHRSCRLDHNGLGCLIADLQQLERGLAEGDYRFWPLYEP